MSGTLYIVGTPIGNLGDITLRAIDTLKMVDFIISEDTRVTSKLLVRYEIKKPLVSYFQHTKEAETLKILERVENGESAALVTDAGTPGISDPGGVIVALAAIRGINIVPIPGVSALTTALSINGVPAYNFVFYGFLPHKKGRQTKLKEIAVEKKTVVIYESPYRIKKLLGELLEYGGDRNISVSRELTKKFEETYRGRITEVVDKIKEKGEFVVIIEGKNE